MTPPRLECNGLTVRYGALTAVDDVSITLNEGRIFGLLGANGAGKTTLFKAITGRVKPTAGKVILDGRDVTGLAEYRRVRAGIVGTHQTPLLFGALSVEDNVGVGARVRRLSGKALHREVDDILERLGLAASRGLRADELSLYQMRLLEIARALATAPRLLLLDESLAGIRDAEIPRMLDIVREVARAGVAIIMVEHILDVIEEGTQHVLLMDGGRLVADEQTSGIRQHEKFREVYLGTGGHADGGR